MENDYVLGWNSWYSVEHFPRGIQRHAPEPFQIQMDLGTSTDTYPEWEFT